MKAVLFFLLVFIAYSASAISVWCNYATGAGSCLLPGVGPTYTCGKKVGFDYYRSESDKKYWQVNTLSSTTFKKFSDCCHASGKGACHT